MVEAQLASLPVCFIAVAHANRQDHYTEGEAYKYYSCRTIITYYDTMLNPKLQ